MTDPPEFMLGLSYNSEYQSVLKHLQPTSRQCMVAIELGYPTSDVEKRMILQEAQGNTIFARRLVRPAQAIRPLTDEGLAEGASTRTSISTAHLIKVGMAPQVAADAEIVAPLSNDPSAGRNLREMSR